MEQQIKLFVERIHKINRNHETITGIRGTTHKGIIMLDLYKSASLLLRSRESDKFEQQIDEIEAKIKIAQATNTLGASDMDELISKLDEIREG